VIGKVVTGSDVRGLVRYLYGPGRANEHTDPHLAGAWTDPQRVEPVPDDHGRRDLGRLVALLEAPLAASARVPEAPVWHCALRAAPGDRVLSDAEWDTVAREVLDRTRLAPAGDHGACRWVAVRHAEDHVHLVVALARQDGRAVSTFRDFYRVGEACQAVEERYGLAATGARDRTAAKRPTRAETEKAARAGQRETPRVGLTREVRHAAAATGSETDFFAVLREAGVLVRPRYSQRAPGQVTGYAVALAGDRGSGDGGPVWFSGGKLSPDLTWPRLRARWAASPERASESGAEEPVTSPSSSLWARATGAVRTSTAQVLAAAGADSSSAGDVPAATADLLIVLARVQEGRRGGPLSTAADRYHRASQEPWSRPSPPSSRGQALRAAARALAAAAPSRRGEGQQFAAPMISVIGLVEAVRALRAVQCRNDQAGAARQAAVLLAAGRTWSQPGPRPGARRRASGQVSSPPPAAPPRGPQRAR
jgi:hypothetical protein